jgi:hypothetical protein
MQIGLNRHGSEFKCTASPKQVSEFVARDIPLGLARRHIPTVTAWRKTQWVAHGSFDSGINQSGQAKVGI